jgi:hypothetical protein
MPSMPHEVLVDLFKNRPSLAAEILVEVPGVSLPPYTEARLAATDLTEIQPAEYRADAVVILLDRDLSVRVIIVEVQRSASASWPRRIRSCWKAGWRRPRSPLPSPRSWPSLTSPASASAYLPSCSRTASATAARASGSFSGIFPPA